MSMFCTVYHCLSNGWHGCDGWLWNATSTFLPLTSTINNTTLQMTSCSHEALEALYWRIWLLGPMTFAFLALYWYLLKRLCLRKHFFFPDIVYTFNTMCVFPLPLWRAQKINKKTSVLAYRLQVNYTTLIILHFITKSMFDQVS